MEDKDCVIGIKNIEYGELTTFWITENNLKEFCKEYNITLKQACDWRNYTYQRFSYCPFCGKKNNFKEIYKNLVEKGE